MKRKMAVVLCMMAMVMGLSGCGNAIPDMSEEQSAVVAEYAAGLLLKYDKNYNTRLVDEEEKEEEAETQEPSEAEDAKPTEEQPEKPSISENQVQDEQAGVSVENASVSIGNFLELGTVLVDYQGFEILDSYTEENASELAFAMDASKGAKLVVAKFLLTNTGGEDVACDMLSKNVRFRINYGAATKNALVTMLSDDLSTLNTTIPAGESVGAVLIIEVKAEEADSITELSLNIKYNENNVSTLLIGGNAASEAAE